jgi:two-component system copper resistance phosphate regulon response regulator CusR
LKLLVVDDDPKFRSYVRRGLEECDIDCTVAENAEDALELIGGAPPAPFDLVLLDVMLPTDSGWGVLQEMRGRGIDVPVIFLTARHSVSERLKGFELGADDYVIKPFAFAELLARIQAVVRRRLSLPVIEADDLSIDLGARVVRIGGRRVDLSPREFELLQVLATGSGEIFSREQLLRRVWDMDFDPGTNVVEVLVRRLRTKIGVERIETVVGKGYRLAVP